MAMECSWVSAAQTSTGSHVNVGRVVGRYAGVNRRLNGWKVRKATAGNEGLSWGGALSSELVAAGGKGRGRGVVS